MGMVYFFELDAPRTVYKNDVRIEREFSIKHPEIWEMLQNKNFTSYYKKILGTLKENYVEALDRNFFLPVVNILNFPDITENMRLIKDDRLRVSVYFGRKIIDEETNKEIDGTLIWQQYKDLLQNMTMGYAEKMVKLSQVSAKMNYFIYQLGQNMKLCYTEQIGELFYIKEGEQYFEDGRLKKDVIQGEVVEFI